MKTKTKTKKSAEFIPITVDVPSEGWAELVTRPEDLKEGETDSMDALVGMFVKQDKYYRVFVLARLVVDLHYQSFILKDQVESGRAYARVWGVLSVEERRQIYRSVGLSLGYDF